MRNPHPGPRWRVDRRAVAVAVVSLAAAGPAAAVEYCRLFFDCNEGIDYGEHESDNVTIDGETYELSKKKFRSAQLVVGNRDAGAVVQTGGVNTVTQRLALGTTRHGRGTYHLIGGALVSQTTQIGVEGASTFVQLGGLHTVIGELKVDWQGAFQIGGGSLNAGSLSVYGDFTQTGGSTLISGGVSTSFADIYVRGGDFSVLGQMQIAHAGLTQTGGDIWLHQTLIVGRPEGGVHAGLRANGGTIHGDVDIVSGGQFNGGGGTVTGTVRLTGQSPAFIDAGTTRVGSLLAQGYREIQVHGTLEASETIETDTLTSVFLQGGGLSARGKIINDGLIGGHGKLQSEGTLRGRGNLIVDGGDLTLAGAGGADLDGNVAISGGHTLFLGARMVNRGSVQLGGGKVRGGGALVIEQAGRLYGPGQIDTPFVNRGQVEAYAGTLRWAQAFDNEGAILVRPDGVIAGEKITNRGRMTVQGEVGNEVLNAGSIEANQGRFTRSFVQSAGGRLTIGPGVSEFADLSLARRATLDVGYGGAAWIHGSAQLGAGSLNQGIGEIWLSGSTQIEGTGFGRFGSAGALALGAGATLTLDLGGTDALLHDRLVATSLRFYQAKLVLRLAPGFVPRAGDRFDLFDGAISGIPAAVDTRAAMLPTGLAWDWSRLASTGELRVTAVPEPATWALALGGVSVLAWWRRRERRSL